MKKVQDYPLSPEEWDFHEVESGEVEWCIRHEYARECPEQTDKLANLIAPETLRKAIGVGLALERAINSGKQTDIEEWREKWGRFHWLHEFVSRCLRQLFSPQLVIAVETAVRFGLDYRDPWMRRRCEVLAKVRRSNECIENLQLVRLEPQPTGSTEPSVDACLTETTPSLCPESTDGFRDPNVGHYALHIEWDLVESLGTIEKLRTDIMRELKKIRPPRSLTGRRAAIPYEELHALAAWRFNRTGLSFEKAQETIRRRAEELNLDLTLKTLHGFPYYKSDLGWTKAIKRADSLIKRLQQQN